MAMLAHSSYHEENGVSFWPSSYEVRDDFGRTGWIAQVHVLQSDSEVLPFWPLGLLRFRTKMAADVAAIHGAERWVREGHPPITKIF